MSGPERTRKTTVVRVIARMNIGGPAYHVSLLSGRLDPDRFETILLTGELGPGEGSFEGLADRYGARREGVPGLTPEMNLVRDLRALVALVRAIRRHRPDVVHTHTAKAGTVGRVAARIARGRRVVVLHTFHGHVLTGYFGPAKSAVFRTMERVLALTTDCLIGVSAATVDELVALGVAPRQKFRTVPIGLDLEPFCRVVRGDGRRFREELGLLETDVLAVCVCRLVPIKRLDVLLDAVSIAVRRAPSLHLAIVGDGESRADAERRASELGLGSTVHFTGFRDDLPQIAAATDIAVLASDNEGTPVALIEAAAAARPAVATDVGGVGDIVGPATGRLVGRGDAAAFGEALVELSGDAQLRDELGAAARRHVSSAYSSERLLRDVAELYDRLLLAKGQN